MEGNPGSSSSSLKGSGDNMVNLKILVPSVAAGAIIGKGGETIADIQKQSGGKIKMSKANDFYPGTNERVCLITGTLDSVTMILDFVMEKIREKPDPNAKPAIDFDNKITAEREKQVKVLIPNSTAGMIIGKGGSFIKQLKDESGAFIQISQKSKDTALQERVITVIGEPDNNRMAMAMILDKILEDPQSGSCLNISYSDVQGLVANFNPTGSPFALNGSHSHADNPHNSPSRQTQNGQSPPSPSTAAGSGTATTASPFILPLHGGGSLQLKFNMNPNRPPTDPSLMSQYLDHIKGALQNSGYSDIAIEESAQSILCLAHHGILVVSLVTSSSASTVAAASKTSNNGTLSSSPSSSSTSGGVHFHPAAAAALPLSDFINRPQNASYHRPPPVQPLSNDAFGYGSGSSVHSHHFARYWSPSNNGSTANESLTPHHMVAAAAAAQAAVHPPMDPAAAAAGAPPLPEPFRGAPAAASPFSQQKFHSQGNKNSFGLATGPPPPQPPPPASNGSLAAAADEQQDQVELEINESIIGAVIGPQGKCIVDIQQFSGARIQISKKGTYSPGTRNRLVNIQGSSKSISAAKYLIEKKILEEEGKRERNAAANGSSGSGSGGGGNTNNAGTGAASNNY